MKLALGNIVYRDINIHHHLSMMKLAQYVEGPLIRSIVGDTLVSRARSELASWFLRTDADVLLSIDSDIEFEAEDAVRLAEQAEDFLLIAGEYPIRGMKTSAALATDVGTGPWKVTYLPAGFMAIHRSVFENLSETLPWVRGNAGPDKFQPFYQPLIHDSLYLSEDWSFCQRARDAGFTCWLDPSIKLVHHGDYGYQFD